MQDSSVRRIHQAMIHMMMTSLMSLFLLPVRVLAVGKSDVIQSAGPMSGSYLVQLVVGLILVLFLIIVLAWLAKRFNRLHSSSNDSLQILGGINMGVRERVVLVQVGLTQLLLGVSPGRINTLYVLEQPLEKPDETSGNSFGKIFSEKLSSALVQNKLVQNKQ